MDEDIATDWPAQEEEETPSSHDAPFGEEMIPIPRLTMMTNHQQNGHSLFERLLFWLSKAKR
jgi:hypothetical protein